MQPDNSVLKAFVEYNIVNFPHSLAVAVLTVDDVSVFSKDTVLENFILNKMLMFHINPPSPPHSYKNIKCYNLQINNHILDNLTIKFSIILSLTNFQVNS